MVMNSGRKALVGTLVNQLGPRLLSRRAIVPLRAEAAVGGVRYGSTVALEKEEQPRNNAMVTSYWEVVPSKVTKEDGSEWKWQSFRVPTFSFFDFVTINIID